MTPQPFAAPQLKPRQQKGQRRFSERHSFSVNIFVTSHVGDIAFYINTSTTTASHSELVDNRVNKGVFASAKLHNSSCFDISSLLPWQPLCTWASLFSRISSIKHRQIKKLRRIISILWLCVSLLKATSGETNTHSSISAYK